MMFLSGFVTAACLIHRANGQECNSCLNGNCTGQVCSTNLDTIFIGGLFALDQNDLDDGLESAMHFNFVTDLLNNKTDGWYDDLLPDTRIVAHVADSKCDAEHAVAGVWELAGWPRQYGHELNAIVGPACSGATNAAMYVAGGMEVPTISYSSTSRDLSGRSPYFFRTCHSDSAKATLLVDYLRRSIPDLCSISQTAVEWHRVGVVTTAKAYGESMAADFSSAWLADDPKNVREFYHRLEVDTDEDQREKNVEEMLLALDKSQVRVVVLTGHTHDVEEIMRIVDKLNIAETATNTVWFTTADATPDLHSLGIMRNGVFSLIHRPPATSEAIAYTDKWRQYTERNAIADYSWNVHDAVLAIAVSLDRMVRGIAVNTTNSSTQFEWSTATPLELRHELRKQLEVTDFRGISGHVRFDQLHDRAAPMFTMHNLQDGRFVPVADTSDIIGDNTWLPRLGVRVLFPDGTDAVPQDYMHSSNFLWVAQLCGVALLGSIGLYMWKRQQFRRKNQNLKGELIDTKTKLQAMSKQLASTMTGLYTVTHDVDADLYEYSLKSGRYPNASQGQGKSQAVQPSTRHRLRPPPRPTGVAQCSNASTLTQAVVNPVATADLGTNLWNTTQWCWEEDSDYIQSHNQSMVITGTNFVHFSQSVNNELEEAYRLYKRQDNSSRPAAAVRSTCTITVDLNNRIASTGTEQKASNIDSGTVFTIDFRTMIQTNAETGFQRKICRHKKVDLAKTPQRRVQALDHAIVDIDLEDVLPCQRRDLTRRMPPPLATNRLYRSPPPPIPSPKVDLPALPDDIELSGERAQSLLQAREGQIVQVTKENATNQWLYGNVIHDPHEGSVSGSSGWFPRSIVQKATPEDMQVLAEGMGSTAMDALATPWTIDPGEPPSTAARIVEVTDTAERIAVEQAFLQTLDSHVAVQKIERIENVPMWQSYAVKKQTTMMLDKGRRIHNRGEIERKWLFHGTSEDIVPLIVQQGFNRAFAGKNATAYGKGVYFARDASYSSSPTYSRPDARGLQRMFMCRVVVGDWCSGRPDVLTPDTKPGTLELFDTTVDCVKNPSIFVAYHDAQAYPEYLISFNQ